MEGVAENGRKTAKPLPLEPKSLVSLSQGALTWGLLRSSLARLPSLAPRLRRPINLTAFMDFSRRCVLINLVQLIKTDFELLPPKSSSLFEGLFALTLNVRCRWAGNDLKLTGNGAQPKTREKERLCA